MAYYVPVQRCNSSIVACFNVAGTTSKTTAHAATWLPLVSM